MADTIFVKAGRTDVADTIFIKERVPRRQYVNLTTFKASS